jgi:arylsulfatase A-like enzyme
LDLANIKKPEYVEFNSLIPMIENKEQESSYTDIYGAYINVQRMMRTDNFKLIIYPKAKKIRLFDVIKDPNEMNDLAHDKSYDSVKKELIEKFKKQHELMDDPLDLHQYFPELF